MIEVEWFNVLTQTNVAGRKYVVTRPMARISELSCLAARAMS